MNEGNDSMQMDYVIQTSVKKSQHTYTYTIDLFWVSEYNY